MSSFRACSNFMLRTETKSEQALNQLLKMKTSNLFLAFLFMLSAAFANAQNTGSAKTAFGILAGVNFQNLNGKDFNGDKLENDMTIGFHGGVNAQIPVAPEFFFQPGLLLSIKGAKNTENAINSTYQFSYLELPLNLVYKGALGNGFVMVGFGPYVGYGIKGKVTLDGNGSAKVESDVEFKNVVELTDPLTTPYYKALDFGGNVFVGYEMAGGIFLQLNSQLGMVNINPEDKRFPNGKTAIKNTGFGLSLGYRF